MTTPLLLAPHQSHRWRRLMTCAAVVLAAVCISACDTYTTVDGAPAYHRGLSDESRGYTAKIPGADAKSFHVLKGGQYAKDASTVYFRGRSIEGADPKTFEVISGEYGRDNRRGYYEGKEIRGADGKALESIPGGWVRDRTDVYAGTRPLHACDSASFRNLGWSWHVDKECAYFQQTRLPDADIKTFKVINAEFAKDAAHVYWASKLLPNADSDTFKLINGICIVCARDANRCYSGPQVIDCKRYETVR